MNTFELVELMNNISKTIDHLKIKAEELEEKYPQNVQHFEVDETVYYIDKFGNITTAVIEEVQNTAPLDGGFYLYWVRPKGSKITIWNKIRFWLVLNCTWFDLKHTVPQGYPGHAVNAGDDIFKTEEDANYMMVVYNSMYNLSDYLLLLKNELKRYESE